MHIICNNLLRLQRFRYVPSPIFECILYVYIFSFCMHMRYYHCCGREQERNSERGTTKCLHIAGAIYRAWHRFQRQCTSAWNFVLIKLSIMKYYNNTKFNHNNYYCYFCYNRKMKNKF